MAAATRSVLRSSSLRTAAARVASEARSSSRPPLLRLRPAAPRFLRSPVEMSFAVESLLPKHSATASALMTSMLTISLRGYGRLSEGFSLSCLSLLAFSPVLALLLLWIR